MIVKALSSNESDLLNAAFDDYLCSDGVSRPDPSSSGSEEFDGVQYFVLRNNYRVLSVYLINDCEMTSLEKGDWPNVSDDAGHFKPYLPSIIV